VTNCADRFKRATDHRARKGGGIIRQMLWWKVIWPERKLKSNKNFFNPGKGARYIRWQG